jgi:hypothetical protein
MMEEWNVEKDVTSCRLRVAGYDWRLTALRYSRLGEENVLYKILILCYLVA